MRKAIWIAAAIVMLFAITCAGAAIAETEGNRLDVAFGLFSVDLPEGVMAGPGTGNVMTAFRYETDGVPEVIAANCAPADEYETAAKGKLNGYISFVFSISFSDVSAYSETKVQEETLENGIRLRWQLMRGDILHALWFEAFDERFGYNMCMYCSAKAAGDDAMLAVMRSFRADPQRERDLLEIRQTKLPGGAFISAEHGLKIQLSKEWNAVTYEDLLLPGTAFVLEKGGGRWMVQLLYQYGWDKEKSRDLLDWFLESEGLDDAAGEPYAVALEALGTEALVAEAAAEHVTMLNVAFVYEGYGYYGRFMWVTDDDAEARPFMMEALRTMSKPGDEGALTPLLGSLFSF